MPPRVPHNVGGLSFPTKAAIDAHLAGIRNGCAVGTVIAAGHEHWAFLLACGQRHVNWDLKSAFGCSAFRVDAWNAHRRQIVLLTAEGEPIEICLTTKNTRSSTPDALRLRAMRAAVQDQTAAAKGDDGAGACAQCGAYGPVDVDHAEPTFDALARAFEAAWDGAAPMWFDKNHWNNPIFSAEDEAYEAAWYAYHHEHAVLQALCHPCHKTKTRETRAAAAQ